MHDPEPVLDPSELRRRALSTWNDEGGAIESVPHERLSEVPEMTDAETMHLRIRVIALEDLMIAVLAEGSDRQLQVAREMAEYISPRSGSAQHPLTIQAADHMTDFVHRALHFRVVQQG